MEKVRCNNCMWEGEEEELTVNTIFGENSEIFYEDACPECRSGEYLMDLI